MHKFYVGRYNAELKQGDVATFLVGLLVPALRELSEIANNLFFKKKKFASHKI